MDVAMRPLLLLPEMVLFAGGLVVLIGKIPVRGRSEATARTLREAFVPAWWSATTAVVAAAASPVLGVGARLLWRSVG